MTFKISRDGAMKAIATFDWPKWKQTETFSEVLAYMVAKGIVDLLPKTSRASVANPPASLPGRLLLVSF